MVTTPALPVLKSSDILATAISGLVFGAVCDLDVSKEFVHGISVFMIFPISDSASKEELASNLNTTLEEILVFESG